MIKCEECVKGFIYGPCGMSYGSAACLVKSRPWKTEPKERLKAYLQMVENYEDGRYFDMREKIKRFREEIEENS